MAMGTNRSEHKSINLSSTAVLSLFGNLSDFPNPDDSNPPGPWGPVIRRAADRVRSVLGPSPEPWNARSRATFAQALAQEVIDRASLMQDVADALPQLGQSQGIIIIGGFLSRFIDDCGTGRIKHPLPPPRHPGDEKLASPELLVMAAQFEQSAAATDNEGLRREFNKASENLLEIGVGRLQSAASTAAV